MNQQNHPQMNVRQCDSNQKQTMKNPLQTWTERENIKYQRIKSGNASRREKKRNYQFIGCKTWHSQASQRYCDSTAICPVVSHFITNFMWFCSSIEPFIGNVVIRLHSTTYNNISLNMTEDQNLQRTVEEK